VGAASIWVGPALAGLVVGLVVAAGVAAAVLLSWAARNGTGARGQLPGGAGQERELAEVMGRVEDQLARMEADRRHLAGGVTEQLRLLQAGQELLRGETSRLSRALRDPSSRGQWGELQLRRVVEMAGMVSQCDFVEQPALQGDSGVLRPDLVVRMPGGRSLAVDAKVPLRAWLEAAEADTDAARRARLAEHARQLRAHISTLGAKEYWAALRGSPEMVVAFLPADALLSGALEVDASVLEYAVSQRVLLATPVTLIAMLRAVSYGWQQEALVDNARLVASEGRDLYRRLAVFSDHLAGLGRSLDRAVGSFNETVGSLESRVLVSARRLAELGSVEREVAPPGPVTAVTRALRASRVASGQNGAGEWADLGGADPSSPAGQVHPDG